MKLCHLNISQASQGLRAKEFSSVELTKSCLEHISQTDPDIHAFLTVADKSALAQAEAADDMLAQGRADVLTGIPMAIKDVISTAGIKTTAASKMLENFVATYDATAVTRLVERGAVIIGKTNLDEFAHGASTEYSAFGLTKNPWDTSRVAGGSSGGSAAAVAAHQALAALGTDTGGSIRHPAAFCGCVGLKPTYGRVSRSGLLSMTSSTDVIGPLTKTVVEAAYVLSAIAGPDAADATSSKMPVADYLAAVDRPNIQDLKIGVPRQFIEGGLNEEIRRLIADSLTALEKLGAQIVPIDLPHALLAVPAYYVITPSEVSANLSRYDSIRFGHRLAHDNLEDRYSQSRGAGFGPEVKRRIMIGTYALSAGYYDAYYLTAQKVREVIKREVAEIFKKVDVIASPTAPDVAFKIGQKSDDPVAMYLEDIYLSLASMTGLPALSLPCGFSQNLPVGLQLIGKWFDEATILSAGAAYQTVTAWHESKPLD